MSKLDIERAANVLVDAVLMGDRKAAQKWDITDKSVRNYRSFLATVPELSALFQAKMTRAARGWSAARIRFLRTALEKAETLVGTAETIEDLPAVTEAIKAVGELQITLDALGADEPDDDGPGDSRSRAAAAEGRQDSAEGEGPDPVH